MAGIQSILNRMKTLLRLTALLFASLLAVTAAEVSKLAPAEAAQRVAAGQAWLSLQGRDLVLTAQESTRLPVSAEAALISAVGPAPITVELLN